MKIFIETLQPQPLWQYFYAITQLPHPSGYTDKIRQFLQDFAASLALEYKTDSAGNVLICKPASVGLEQAKTIILQAHMDMVPQKNSGVAHNFETDALQVFVAGNWVKATDTTLGADNGLGVAAILAVLASNDIKHGPLRALFTNDEETGMHGAFGLDKAFLQGDILLNLDSEDEGELFVGCAGGIDADFVFPLEMVTANPDDMAIVIAVSGLQGGHSGIDIHLERANANKLLFRFLKMAATSCDARLASVLGGSLRNAIPREASAVISIPVNKRDGLIRLLEETSVLFSKEYYGIETELRLDQKPHDKVKWVFSNAFQEKIIHTVCAAPNGVFNHIPEMPTVVESSSNLAVILTDERRLVIKYLLRSSVESKKQALCAMHDSFFTLAGASAVFFGDYPGWQANFESPLLAAMRAVYKDKFGLEPTVKLIHAGLECGILGALNPQLDMLSFGPTIRFPHSPDEKLAVDSVQRFWDFLIAGIESVATNKNAV